LRILQSVFWILVYIAAGYAVILLLMYALQSQMIYHPQKEILVTPSEVGLPFEDVQFQTTDKLNLHGWFVPADSTKPTILYFHGNAGNISGRMETIQLLHQLGLNVFIFDYRGYGKSEGNPSEEGTYRDATAAWKYLTADRKISEQRIIVMGRSLGGSIAVWLAARHEPAAAIIESTFISAADLGADIYPWLPVRWMIRYDYNTLENIKKLSVPLFMAHSRDDQVVPFHHGQILFKEANEPKTFVELRGSHAAGFWESGAKYRESLRQFLDSHTVYQSKIKK
jgi:fermentation-respiration switch protein FrsA (DUF1100 family)